jgi:O-antigen/teichoic acid export membrane protein
MLRFSAQSSVLLLLNLIVWNRSELFFLKHLCDIREVAFFSLAFGLVRSLAELTQPLTWAASPTLMKAQAGEHAAAGRVTVEFLKYLSLLATPMTFGMAALAPSLVLVLYGPRYSPAIPVLIVGVLLGLPSILSSPAHYLLAAADAQSFLVRWLTVCAGLTLLIDWWLVARWCAAGGSAANGLAQIVASLGVWAFAIRRFGVPIPVGLLARILAAGGAMGLLVAALTTVLTPLQGLILGPPAGVLLYGVLLRQVAVLDERDHQRLLQVAETIPAPLRALSRFVIGLLTGRSAG